MGKSIKNTYAVVVTELDPRFQRFVSNTYSWQGKASDKMLAKWVIEFARSFQPGGTNYHISLALGYVPAPCKAKIVTNNRQRYTMATWEAAPFQVF